MKNRQIVFFRNDDLRGTLDDSLIKITDIFINNQLPITHAVEPANVTKDVIVWLLELKKKYPSLIEIVQHGYNHNLNYKKVVGNKLKKGEFGGDRSYSDQLADITAGKSLMEDYFGDQWFPCFTFPYGARNRQTIKALNDSGYKVINGGVSTDFNHKLLYIIGRTLNREMIYNRKISYNLRYKPDTKLFQIDLGISFIKKYYNEFDLCEFNSLSEMTAKTKTLMSLPNIGILIHHRYHKTPESIKLIEDYIKWIKNLSNVHFLTQQEIFQLYAR